MLKWIQERMSRAKNHLFICIKKGCFDGKKYRTDFGESFPSPTTVTFVQEALFSSDECQPIFTVLFIFRIIEFQNVMITRLPRSYSFFLLFLLKRTHSCNVLICWRNRIDKLRNILNLFIGHFAMFLGMRWKNNTHSSFYIFSE